MISNGLLNANFQAQYRARSNVAPISLVRKKCGTCKKVVTAKQFKRAGLCELCVKVVV